MRLDELEMIAEVNVISSWIEDLEYEDDSVVMTLISGRQYRIHDIDYEIYEEWMKSMSKGKFWHSDIKDFFNVVRI